MDIDQFVALIQSHAWIPLASIAIGFAVRLVKSDAAVAWFPVAIPPQVRSWLALGLGLVAGVLDKVVAGSSWSVALMGGIAAAITAISGHELVIESLRGGREIGEAKDSGAGGGGVPRAAVKIASLKPDAPVGPYSHMVRHHLVALVCCVMSSVMFCGCAAFNPSQIPQWIQQALAVEQNIAAIVSALQAAADFFLSTTSVPDATKQSVEQAFQDVSLAEAAVSELLYAGDSVTQEQLDAAYDHLKTAYSNLTKLLANVGVVSEVASGAFAAKKGNGQVVLVPLALKVRVVKR